MTVPVRLYLDQIHLLLLAITTTVNLLTHQPLLIAHARQQICCGMDIVAIMLKITAV